jgi:hypothetical protein
VIGLCDTVDDVRNRQIVLALRCLDVRCAYTRETLPAVYGNQQRINIHTANLISWCLGIVKDRWCRLRNLCVEQHAIRIAVIRRRNDNLLSLPHAPESHNLHPARLAQTNDGARRLRRRNNVPRQHSCLQRRGSAVARNRKLRQASIPAEGCLATVGQMRKFAVRINENRIVRVCRQNHVSLSGKGMDR